MWDTVFPTHAVQAFDSIGGVDNFPDGGREGEERGHFLPGPSPGRCYGSVFVAPSGLERVQGDGGLIGGGRLINPAQVGGMRRIRKQSGGLFSRRLGLAVLPGAEVRRMAHQMHDTGLDRRLRKGRRDRLGEALEPVHNGDQHVLNAAVAQFVHHRKPEFGPFIVSYPEAKNLAQPVAGDAQSHVNCVRRAPLFLNQWRTILRCSNQWRINGSLLTIRLSEPPRVCRRPST